MQVYFTFKLTLDFFWFDNVANMTNYVYSNFLNKEKFLHPLSAKNVLFNAIYIYLFIWFTFKYSEICIYTLCTRCLRL